MRSAKYAIMFISLTFLIFFFVEILNRKRIHPFQYILVGLALTLFYTLLVSLSEHINFNLAYLISCIGVIGMITFYAASIFKNKLLTAILSLVLLVLYGFMFITLQMQDYALLIGSIGLFAVLATVMYLSRNINWYSIHKD
jgi:inner membrane protein